VGWDWARPTSACPTLRVCLRCERLAGLLAVEAGGVRHREWCCGLCGCGVLCIASPSELEGAVSH
jgi:hypothetical protein